MKTATAEMAEAQYPGICSVCDGRIEVGEEIEFDERDEGWVHLDCYDE